MRSSLSPEDGSGTRPTILERGAQKEEGKSTAKPAAVPQPQATTRPKLTRGTQLGQQKGLHVLVVALERLARLDEVDEDGLLRALTSDLGRLQDGPAALARQLGVVLAQDAEHTVCTRV